MKGQMDFRHQNQMMINPMSNNNLNKNSSNIFPNQNMMVVDMPMTLANNNPSPYNINNKLPQNNINNSSNNKMIMMMMM